MGSPLLLLLALLTMATKAKVFGLCELAHVLQEEGLDGSGAHRLADCEFQSPVCPQPFLPSCCHPQGWQLWHSLSAFCPCPELCMASYETTFNMSAQGIKVYGSTDHGIFQSSSQLWCTDSGSASDNLRGMASRGAPELLLHSQPQEQRQQPEPFCSAQLQLLAKMELRGHAGRNLGHSMPVAMGSWE